MSSSQEDSPPPAFEPPLDIEALDELRGTLLRGDEAHPSGTVESVLDGVMSRKIGESKGEMAAATAPSVGQAIRQQGTEALHDIIDVLNPVIGRTNQQSEPASMRPFACLADKNLRSTLGTRRMLRHLKARTRGFTAYEPHLQDSLPFCVQEIFLKPSRVDRQRLVQAINNLVSNALKFTPVGGRVSIKVTPMNGVLAVEISDTGPGISAEDQARLFQRFFRTLVSRRRQIPGTGLGLSIVRAIAEQHGGEAYCRSQLGKGSTFGFTLPIAGD